MQRTIDGNDIALAQHLLQGIATTAANLLLDLRLQGLVIEIQQFLAIERLQPSQHSLADSAHSNGSNNLVLEIVFVLGHTSDVPFAGLDLLVRGDEVAHEDEDGHDDVLGDGDDVGAGDLGHGDATVGLVGGIEVDVVGADTGGDGELELLGFGETFGVEVARVESVERV